MSWNAHEEFKKALGTFVGTLIFICVMAGVAIGVIFILSIIIPLGIIKF